MKLNKFSNNQFQLDLNLAELRILTALIGNHSGHSAAAIVNESTIVRDGLAKRISTFEGATFVDNYYLLHDALKEEVVEVIKVIEFVYDKGEYVSPRSGATSMSLPRMTVTSKVWKMARPLRSFSSPASSVVVLSRFPTERKTRSEINLTQIKKFNMKYDGFRVRH